jgi:hypothetical protein
MKKFGECQLYMFVVNFNVYVQSLIFDFAKDFCLNPTLISLRHMVQIYFQ